MYLQLVEVKAQKKGLPDFPGSFNLDLGFNVTRNQPANFNTSFFGSRTFNVNYQAELKIPLLKTEKLYFMPGIGLGFDRFKFQNGYTLNYESGDLVMSKRNLSISESRLIMNYIDFPIDLKYYSNPYNKSACFNFSVGFKAGFLLNAQTKLAYNEKGITYKEKKRSDWELNKFRYGLQTKVGFGNFSLFTFYNLTTVFKENKGPNEASVNNLIIGISLSGF
jgi:hypothetical protein